MTRNIVFIIYAIASFFTIGCANKLINIDPSPDGPLYKEKSEFINRYFNFVTDNEKLYGYPDLLPEPIKPFNEINTLDEWKRFDEHFWKIRDIDPSTPQNEYKDLIDERISDIESEIFLSDPDIPQTRFETNGGLRGDMARVYLLWGQPNLKAKISGESNPSLEMVDIMVWYYLDNRGRVLFRFFFYQKYGKMSLFKEYVQIMRETDLYDPAISPLRKISNKIFPSPEDLYEMFLELQYEDPEWLFIGAILSFSSYNDVVMENGDRKRFGALDPPEPASLVAIRVKPAIIGQPVDLGRREFLYNKYFSFIPARLEISKDNRPLVFLNIGYKDIDWEIRGDNVEMAMGLRISFQNKESREVKEFYTKFYKTILRDEVENKIKGTKIRNMVVPITMHIPLEDLENLDQLAEPMSTLGQLILGLEPGNYVVNAELADLVTKKMSGGWREEIVIK